MEEFGDGCILDDESIGGAPKIDLRVAKEEPVAIGDIIKETCDKWYEEDQCKALILEKSRRNAVDLDEFLFEKFTNARKAVYKWSVIFTGTTLLVGIPYLSYQVYSFFSSEPVQESPVPVPEPAPVPSGQQPMMVASYTVVYPSGRKRAVVVVPSRQVPVQKKPGGFWINAFNVPGP